MTFTTPNSAGFADIDEANSESTHAYTSRGKKKCKRKMREFNACHDPGTGKFCAGKSAADRRWQRTLRRASGSSADRTMSRLEAQMKGLAKSRPWLIFDHGPKQSRVSRAVTLRKRMDVVGPLAYRQRQNSFIGSIKRVLFRGESYKGKKR